MRVIARIGPGPAWQQGKSVFEQGDPMLRHLHYMRDRYDDGQLLLGGPYTEDAGGLAVLDVADMAAARALAVGDPAVAAGVLGYDLSELVPYFDAFVGTRSDGSLAGLRRHRQPSS
jgi:uncharacterized protein YciI